MCVRVRVVHARACSHSCIWPLWMYACASVCKSAHMRHGCDNPGMYEFIRVFCFLDTYRRLNWSSFPFGLSAMFLVMPEEFQNWTRERERERETERGRERGTGIRQEGGKWWKRKSLESLQSFTGLGMPHYVILPNYSPPPSDIRPDASRLRTVHGSCADGDRSETSPPPTLQQRRLTAVASLMTFHCFSKSTFLFNSLSRNKTSWDWQVTQTAVLVVRSLARHFCFPRGGHGVTTEGNILH